MGPTLPVNLEDLLAYRGVESEGSQNPMRVQLGVFQRFLSPLFA